MRGRAGVSRPANRRHPFSKEMEPYRDPRLMTSPLPQQFLHLSKYPANRPIVSALPRKRYPVMVNISTSDPVDVSIALKSDDFDDQQLDDATRRLRTELLELDVEQVVEARGQAAPEGTRGVGAELVGQLIVGMGPGLVALRQLLETVRSWRTQHHQVDISVRIGEDLIELTDASPETERQLVDAFIQRHANA